MGNQSKRIICERSISNTNLGQGDQGKKQMNVCSLKAWIRKLACKSEIKRESWETPIRQRPDFIQSANFPPEYEYEMVLLKLLWNQLKLLKSDPAD